MAEIAPDKVYSERVGSLALKIVQLTLATTGDTYTIEKYAPVVDYWCQTHIGTAGYKPDVSWSADTGTFTFTQDAQLGNTSLFVLMRT
jgi:hypothetical protein